MNARSVLQYPLYTSIKYSTTNDMLLFLHLTVVIDAYRWLVCRLLVDSSDRLKSQLGAGHDGFTARNNSQVYYCRTLALAYVEVRLEGILFTVF